MNLWYCNECGNTKTIQGGDDMRLCDDCGVYMVLKAVNESEAQSK